MTNPSWGKGEPASHAFSVTPSDSVGVDTVTRGLYVGGAGDVAVEMERGGAVTFVGVPAGSVLPIRVRIVKATGTTATSIVGLY